MKGSILSAFFLLSMACQPDFDVIVCFPPSCGAVATVRYRGNLDGCSYVFELADGRVVVPERRVYIKPPSIEEDPIYYHSFVHGAKVRIGFRSNPETSSACQYGPIVFITCIETIQQPQS